jgi:hypothetical protein
MQFIVGELCISALYFTAMLLLIKCGRWYGRKRLADDPEKGLEGTGPVEGAVFGLYGLFMAFSFSGAIERFSDRRRQVIEELNDVGTSWMRLDLLPVKDQPPIREAFRKYVAARIDYHMNIDTQEKADHIAAVIEEHRLDIWSRSIAAFREAGFNAATSLCLSSENDMFDMWDRRRFARYEHTPYVMFLLLYGMGLVSAFLVGNATSPSAKPQRAFAIIFAVLSAVTAYFIVDIEFPRHGLVRIDSIDVILKGLLQEIGLPH